MPQARYSAPTASGPLDASLSIPGSKSLTNRELVLAALADGPSLLTAPLVARDTELMVRALLGFGAGRTVEAGSGAFGPDWRIDPIPTLGAATTPTERRIDVGLAGTVMRFVPPIAALLDGETTFDGDEAARRRPMAATVEALRALGVAVDAAPGDRLPFTVHGTGRVPGGELAIDASASSQFVSGLLLAAARFERGLVLHHVGARLPSMPHIEMTVACLAERGVDVASPEPGTWVVAPGPIAARDVAIEPDLSNAAPFLAAPLVAGGGVTIAGWPRRTTQVGALLPDLLAAFGATASVAGGGLTVTASGAPFRGIDLDLTLGGELAPTIVGLAALATTPSRITGIGHLRGHETDRLAALVADIRALGGDAVELPDGIEVRAAAAHGGEWGAYADHRMATTGALIGLRVPGVVVDDLGATSKTIPEFGALWERMLGR